MENKKISLNIGVIVSVHGSVVDIRFDTHLPPIYSLLHAEDGKIAIEVLTQLDAHRVRGIALTPTQGLARGMAVEDTGGPLKAPVGKGILSRMFDVFGNAIDRQTAPTNVQWRTVHRDPPTLTQRSTRSEIFETGIKVIDVLAPLERGGKAGLFGGAGGIIQSAAEYKHEKHKKSTICAAPLCHRDVLVKFVPSLKPLPLVIDSPPSFDRQRIRLMDRAKNPQN
jgi:F-type H+-transporting ATPase subunit beta